MAAKIRIINLRQLTHIVLIISYRSWKSEFTPDRRNFLKWTQFIPIEIKIDKRSIPLAIKTGEIII